MYTLAATTSIAAATDSDGLAEVITVAVVALVITVAGYLAVCWLSPFTGCHHTNHGRAYRCPRCHGTGTRLRAGRHLINRLRNTRHH